MLTDIVRNRVSRFFSGQKEIIFRNSIPSQEKLREKFSDLDELGLYLHIPFCERICPYCPYNKEIYTDEKASKYIDALKKEIDYYASIVGRKDVTTFYIGGGTPTTLLGMRLDEIIYHVYKRFNMNCNVHLESHPNHLSVENLQVIESLGVKFLSIGVEALQDKYLQLLERPYTVKDVKQSVESALKRNFECVNIDFIFDLPGQSIEEIERAGKDIVGMGVHQVATYPLFRFPYTRLGNGMFDDRNALGTMFRRRKYLKILEDIFYDADYYRSSVWAFTKKGVDKYCSVTVPLYLGLGASGSTYLKDMFYVNTFSVNEYVKAINERSNAIALSVDLTEKMQMSGWLYWRIYETAFRKSDFNERFNKSFDKVYGIQMKLLNRIGYLKNGQDQMKLTSKGAYWIHAFEDYFSINYINKLWGRMKNEPWPEKVKL